MRRAEFAVNTRDRPVPGLPRQGTDGGLWRCLLPCHGFGAFRQSRCDRMARCLGYRRQGLGSPRAGGEYLPRGDARALPRVGRALLADAVAGKSAELAWSRLSFDGHDVSVLAMVGADPACRADKAWYEE